jgi:glucose dehydrogenase
MATNTSVGAAAAAPAPGHRWLRAAAALVLGVTPVLACGNRGADASRQTAHADTTLRRAMADGQAWPSYGRDYTNRRWSPLSQITTANVAALAPAWIFHSGIVHSSESSPIVVDGVMYLSTALNHVVALDATTGVKKWEYVHSYRTTVDCCGPINRGVAVYDGRVYMATVDARLVALDAATGQKAWDVVVGDNLAGIHLDGAPIAVDGKIVVGVSGGEQGCRCYVDAYDARTGRRVWRWYTIPSPAAGGWWGTWRTADEWGQSFGRDVDRERADSARYSDSWRHGGGPVWHHPAYDPEMHMLFINVGNPAPDNDGTTRPGDNLYTDCIVALDVNTGTVKWYYQEVSHDLWDYDATTPPMLLDAPDGQGHSVKAVAEAGKDGFVYVLDRATGRPLRKSVPLAPLLRYMQPPTPEGVIENPGTLGGSDWSPMAYSPQTGYAYAEENYFPMKYRQKLESLQPPAQWWDGGVVATPAKDRYGFYTAVDLATGKIAWQARSPTPLIGGAMATASGLVFFAGAADDTFVALDARTGHELWRYSADAGVNAPPITYQVGETQFVAVAATGLLNLNDRRGDEMIAFALPPATRLAARIAPSDSAARGGP